MSTIDIVQREVSVDGTLQFGFGNARRNRGDFVQTNEAAVASDTGVKRSVCWLGTGIVNLPGLKRLEKVGKAVHRSQDLEQGDIAFGWEYTQQGFTLFRLNFWRADMK